MELPLAAFLWHQIGACALLFSTLLYSTLLFSSLFYSYLLLSFLLCSILLFCALLCSSVFFSSPLSCTLYSFLACSSQLFSSLPHPTLPYSSPLSSTLLYSTLPYWGSEMRAKYWTYQAAEKCPRWNAQVHIEVIEVTNIIHWSSESQLLERSIANLGYDKAYHFDPKLLSKKRDRAQFVTCPHWSWRVTVWLARHRTNKTRSLFLLNQTSGIETGTKTRSRCNPIWQPMRLNFKVTLW